MPGYFQNMHVMGKEIKADKANVESISMIEKEIKNSIKKVINAGRSVGV